MGASFCACKQNGFSCIWPGKKGLLAFQQIVSRLLSYQSEFNKNRAFPTCPFSREDQSLIFTVKCLIESLFMQHFFMPCCYSSWSLGCISNQETILPIWPSFYLLKSTRQCLVIPSGFQLLGTLCYQQSYVSESEN